MGSSNAHQAKRPYGGTHSAAQTTITSYFSSQPYNTTVQTSTNPVASPLSPPLPAHIQSNLLSVGMRIRKSVPEGYKTGSLYNGFSLFSETTPKGSPSQPLVPQSKYVYGGGRKELTPFCGILKVGGLAQQGLSGEQDDVPDEDDFPFLSSQGSTISNVSVQSMPAVGKRRFNDDDDDFELEGGHREDGGIIYEPGIWRDEPTSPRTRPMNLARKTHPSSSTSPSLCNSLLGRSLATPKTRRRHAPGKVPGIGHDGQENVMIDADFEEADFLDVDSWMGDDMELVDS